jgi:hypothetical protein
MRAVRQKIFLATIRLSIAATLSASANETVFAQGGHKPVGPIQAPLAEQDDGVGPVVHNPASPNLAGRYFVDFRARTAATYGHAFIWYGQLTPQGKIGMVEVAGLHPATDNPVPYIIGHVFPVPSETGKSYGDLDEQYLTASYRVYLSEADAKKVFAYIKHKQETSPVWIAGMINCTSFVADIASYMGLKTPLTGTWMYPEDLVNSIRDLNKGRHEISLATAND